MNIQLFKGDRVVWAIYACLVAISIVEVFSASTFLSRNGGNYLLPIGKHIVFLGIGGLLAWVFHHIPCRYFRLLPLFLLPLVVLLLLYVLFAGVTVNDGARWIDVMGISFQPSELAKGVLVLSTALSIGLSANEEGISMGSLKFILGSTIFICALIVTQNLSTALFIFFIVFVMLFLARIRTKWLLWIGGTCVAGAMLGLVTFKLLPEDPESPIYDGAFSRAATWRARIFNDNMKMPLDPREFVVHDKNRQVVDSRIAIARAEGLGLGPGRSIQRYHLAEAYSDFIFAIIIEEMGLIGCAFVIALYLLLLYRTGRIASRCESHFPAHLVMGLGVLIVTQAMINMAVAVGIGPVTGQTLPLISKGGSSMIITSVYFGMILSISRIARRKDMTPLRALSDDSDAAIEEFSRE